MAPTTVPTVTTTPSGTVTTTVAPTTTPSGTVTTTVLSYRLSGLTVNQLDVSTSTGQALRGAMTEAFASSAGVAKDTVTMTSVVAYTRRAGVTVDFTVTGASVDETAVNAAMTDTSASGFGQLFVTAASSVGQAVSVPTVVFQTQAPTAAPTNVSCHH